jgi:hypothetical protein
MKSIFNLFNVVIFFSLLFFACSKKSDYFSCEPSINEWAKKYKNSFHGISREEFAKIPLAYQKAVYRTLTPEEKYLLWKEKLEIVLNLPLDQNLKLQIQGLSSRINSTTYDRDLMEPLDPSIQLHLTNWENDILANGKMDSVNFVINFCTLMTAQEIHTMVFKPETVSLKDIPGSDEMKSFKSSQPGGGGNELPDCSCLYDVYCSVLGGRECKDGLCKEVRDCGVLGTSICNGLCPEETID